MADIKTILLDQLLANANDRSWYLSFSEAVDSLSESDAFWKPDDTSHSIAEIVQHLIYWNETWQLRYKENQVNAVPTMSINANTFLISDGETFFSLKEKLLEVFLHWQEILDINQLTSTVNGFPEKAEWWAILSNTATHNANHIGQIIYIRKMKK
ncbi:DinB family protein [Guptibacillus spartinae]|uniref:DinB family protein n=1 Tax=Guptibacillus spartinae TaxID=3025679 RepID=UPI002362A6E6|nr:DinB family protein [Pseudalkalibacillus spartinae]